MTSTQTQFSEEDIAVLTVNGLTVKGPLPLGEQVVLGEVHFEEGVHVQIYVTAGPINSYEFRMTRPDGRFRICTAGGSLRSFWIEILRLALGQPVQHSNETFLVTEIRDGQPWI